GRGRARRRLQCPGVVGGGAGADEREVGLLAARSGHRPHPRPRRPRVPAARLAARTASARRRPALRSRARRAGRRVTAWEDARARFPVLDRYAYLNAGTNGPLSAATIAAAAAVNAWEAEHGRAGKAHFDEMLERRERVRGLLAAQLGVDPANVALTDSTTRAVHVAVAGLGLGPGDEGGATDSGHFGLLGPVSASGGSVRIVPIRELRAAALFDAIASHVTPRTRLLALSAVVWLDGKVVPWAELREQTDVPVLVDGAQSVGAVEVDATAADFYTLSAQK